MWKFCRQDFTTVRRHQRIAAKARELRGNDGRLGWAPRSEQESKSSSDSDQGQADVSRGERQPRIYRSTLALCLAAALLLVATGCEKGVRDITLVAIGIVIGGFARAH